MQTSDQIFYAFMDTMINMQTLLSAAATQRVVADLNESRVAVIRAWSKGDDQMAYQRMAALFATMYDLMEAQLASTNKQGESSG